MDDHVALPGELVDLLEQLFGPERGAAAMDDHVEQVANFVALQ